MSIGKIQVVDNQKQYVRFATLGGAGSREVSGIQVGNVQDLALEESTDRLTLTWKDPEDIVFNGETTAEWAGTKVVRKEGSSPESAEDGTLIADSTVRDQYSVDGLQDTDVAAGTQYHYTLFPYTAKNVYTMSDLNKLSGSLKEGYDSVLSNNTWTQISNASKSGIAKDLWKEGDVKDDCVIIGFDHDDLADGSGKAGITFMTNANTKAYSRLSSDSTSSFIQYKNLEGLNEYLETFLDTLPNELKKNVKTINKAVYVSSSTTTVEEFNFVLLSMVELTNNNYVTNTGKLKDGTVYKYLVNEYLPEHKNEKIWTRTPDYSSYYYVACRDSNSFGSNSGRINSNSVKFCFCI